ncbi:hypothetical protein GOBAR_AA25058 [Gossypium barbadense]|uniref:Uncharacterized protein n=1 Tax=Gossypium barbadense TaxID=3634 RepID=A0A2P5WWY8_GOSBA|nr:hypothetical protein GOBAR_AA25058 [Gossypium barbadense]
MWGKKKKWAGAFRESNSGPLAPKARIIPLDQMPNFGYPSCLGKKKFLNFTTFFEVLMLPSPYAVPNMHSGNGDWRESNPNGSRPSSSSSLVGKIVYEDLHSDLI